MAKWYLTRDGQEFGPLSADQLRALVAKGRIIPESLLRREDMKQPVRAADIKGLLSATPPQIVPQSAAGMAVGRVEPRDPPVEQATAAANSPASSEPPPHPALDRPLAWAAHPANRLRVLLGAGGAATVVAVLICCGGLVGGGGAGGSAMDQNEFRSMVENRTMEEVLQAVGRPDDTTAYSARDQMWFYSRPTFDPLTGDTASSVTLNIKRGRVKIVLFD